MQIPFPLAPLTPQPSYPLPHKLINRQPPWYPGTLVPWYIDVICAHLFPIACTNLPVTADYLHSDVSSLFNAILELVR